MKVCQILSRRFNPCFSRVHFINLKKTCLSTRNFTTKIEPISHNINPLYLNSFNEFFEKNSDNYYIPQFLARTLEQNFLNDFIFYIGRVIYDIKVNLFIVLISLLIFVSFTNILYKYAKIRLEIPLKSYITNILFWLISFWLFKTVNPLVNLVFKTGFTEKMPQSFILLVILSI